MIFDKSHASHNQILKLEMAKLIDKYKLKEGDTGSIEVQGTFDCVCGHNGVQD